MTTYLGSGLVTAMVGWMYMELGEAHKTCSYKTHYGNITTLRLFRCEDDESCCRRSCCGGSSPPDLTRVWFFWLTVILPFLFMCIFCGFNMRKRAKRLSRVQVLQQPPNIINVTNVQGSPYGPGASTNMATQTQGPHAGGINPSGGDIFLAGGAAKPMQPAYAMPGVTTDD